MLRLVNFQISYERFEECWSEFLVECIRGGLVFSRVRSNCGFIRNCLVRNKAVLDRVTNDDAHACLDRSG